MKQESSVLTFMLLKETNFFLKCSSVNRVCWGSGPGKEGSDCKGPAAGLGHCRRALLSHWAQSHHSEGPCLIQAHRWVLADGDAGFGMTVHDYTTSRGVCRAGA